MKRLINWIIILVIILIIYNLNFENKDKKELQGSITLITNRTDKSETRIKDLANEFQKLHPKTYIRVEGIKDVDEEINYRNKNNTLGDIIVIPASWSYKDYERYLEPVDDLGFSENNIYFYENMKFRGRVYGINSGINLHGIIYNKAVFREAGIEKIPKTKEEFYEICEKIKIIKKVPIGLNYNDKWALSPYLYDVYASYQDKYIGNKEFVEKGIFDESSSLLEAFDFARNINSFGYAEKDLYMTNWGNFKKSHAKGDIAMTAIGTWYIPQLLEEGLQIKDIGMFPFPDSKRILVGPDYFFGINNKSQNKILAKEFLKFMINEDRYSNAVGIITPIKKSKSTLSPVKELLESGLPIADILKEDKEYYEIKEEFNENLLEILSEYIVVEDIEKFREEKNLLWKKAQKSLMK